MRFVLFLMGLALWIPLLSFGGCRIYKNIVFGIECGGHLKRAADANTIELAKKEMEAVVAYLEREEMTEGYTSIIYRTPDEDVGFWYVNLKSSLQELQEMPESATQLEKSNVLMKLRETILDDSGTGVTVTVPEGISVFPHNILFAVWFLLGVFTAIVGSLLSLLVGATVLAGD